MRGFADPLCQFRFSPSKVTSRTQIPCPFFRREICLQNDHVLRPSDFCRQIQQRGCILIGAIEFPHTTQVAWGETRSVRVVGLQVFGGRDSRAFFGSGTDQLTDLNIQLHLWQLISHQFIQRGVHGAVICGLSDIHGILLPGEFAIFVLSQRKARQCRAFLCNRRILRTCFVETIYSQAQ